jgi:hypothetical protein
MIYTTCRRKRHLSDGKRASILDFPTTSSYLQTGLGSGQFVLLCRIIIALVGLFWNPKILFDRSDRQACVCSCPYEHRSQYLSQLRFAIVVAILSTLGNMAIPISRIFYQLSKVDIKIIPTQKYMRTNPR